MSTTPWAFSFCFHFFFPKFSVGDVHWVHCWHSWTWHYGDVLLYINCMRKHIQTSSNLQFSTSRTFQLWRSVTYWVILTLLKLRRHAARFAWLPRLTWIMGTVEGVANTIRSVRKPARAWLAGFWPSRGHRRCERYGAIPQIYIYETRRWTAPADACWTSSQHGRRIQRLLECFRLEQPSPHKRNMIDLCFTSWNVPRTAAEHVGSS